MRLWRVVYSSPGSLPSKQFPNLGMGLFGGPLLLTVTSAREHGQYPGNIGCLGKPATQFISTSQDTAHPTANPLGASIAPVGKARCPAKEHVCRLYKKPARLSGAHREHPRQILEAALTLSSELSGVHCKRGHGCLEVSREEGNETQDQR